MEVEWYYYAGFIAFVVATLIVDLRFFHTEEHEPTLKESATWLAVWISLAVIFGVIIFVWQGSHIGFQFVAGYLIEYSLSVDNMFVFIVIFSYFSIPLKYQHQVLFYGILGAIIFRGIFIAIGVALINRFDWVIPIFGAFLIFTAFRLARGGGDDIHPEDNPILKFAQKRFPSTPNFDGQKLFTIENGKRLATPLFITLIFIEITDVVFALDSIPAIFGITQEPFIVLTSNVFAVLGLRALYFTLAGAMNRLHLLHYGLAVVLGFVGVKMIVELWHFEIPIWLSLLVIVGVLAITTVLSLKITPKDEAAKDNDPSSAHE